MEHAGLAAIRTLVYSVVVLVGVPALWRVFQRAGFAGAWAFVALVPFLGLLVASLLLAFRAWPAERAPGDGRVAP